MSGLADSIGHLVPVMKERFGERVRFNMVKPKRPLLKRFGVAAMGEAIDAAAGRVDDHAHWSRFGLQAPR